MDSPCADHVFTMFLAKGAAKAKGTSCKGDVLMRPSWILLPFIPRLVQRIGSETLIAGRLRVHTPVTHPRAQRRRGRSGEGDVLMRPSWILMPFIPPRVQRIGSETLIAGRLRVHLPVTHPRAQRIERERAKRTGRSATTLSY
jgi:hypothetical protein